MRTTQLKVLHAALGRIELAASWGRTCVPRLVREIAKDYPDAKVREVVKQPTIIRALARDLAEQNLQVDLIWHPFYKTGWRVGDLRVSWDVEPDKVVKPKESGMRIKLPEKVTRLIPWLVFPIVGYVAAYGIPYIMKIMSGSQ